jgi:hypothetical protein
MPEGTNQETTTYIACPQPPQDDENADPNAGNSADEHLYGCSICAEKTGAPGTANSRYCERCKPGYMEMMGGCFKIDEGVETHNDEICGRHCEDCRRFSGPHNALDFRCAKCKDGFFQDSHGNGDCHEPAQNHCT